MISAGKGIRFGVNEPVEGGVGFYTGSQMGSPPEDSMKPPDLDLESGSAASPEVQETRFHAAYLSTGGVNEANGGSADLSLRPSPNFR